MGRAAPTDQPARHQAVARWETLRDTGRPPPTGRPCAARSILGRHLRPTDRLAHFQVRNPKVRGTGVVDYPLPKGCRTKRSSRTKSVLKLYGCVPFAVHDTPHVQHPPTLSCLEPGTSCPVWNPEPRNLGTWAPAGRPGRNPEPGTQTQIFFGAPTARRQNPEPGTRSHGGSEPEPRNPARGRAAVYCYFRWRLKREAASLSSRCSRPSSTSEAAFRCSAPSWQAATRVRSSADACHWDAHRNEGQTVTEGGTR